MLKKERGKKNNNRSSKLENGLVYRQCKTMSITFFGPFFFGAYLLAFAAAAFYFLPSAIKWQNDVITSVFVNATENGLVSFLCNTYNVYSGESTL